MPGLKSEKTAIHHTIHCTILANYTVDRACSGAPSETSATMYGSMGRPRVGGMISPTPRARCLAAASAGCDISGMRAGQWWPGVVGPSGCGCGLLCCARVPPAHGPPYALNRNWPPQCGIVMMLCGGQLLRARRPGATGPRSSILLRLAQGLRKAASGPLPYPQ